MPTQESPSNIIKITTYTVYDVLADIDTCESKYPSIVTLQRDTLEKCKQIISGQKDLINDLQQKAGAMVGTANKEIF